MVSRKATRAKTCFSSFSLHALHVIIYMGSRGRPAAHTETQIRCTVLNWPYRHLFSLLLFRTPSPQNCWLGFQSIVEFWENHKLNILSETNLRVDFFISESVGRLSLVVTTWFIPSWEVTFIGVSKVAKATIDVSDESGGVDEVTRQSLKPKRLVD